ncbi:MAG: type II toxin-antitoxin system YoeB family toxin [Dongiaceae bacterium]
MEDDVHWREADRDVLRRINELLLKDAHRNSFKGIGKPETLEG